MKIEIEVEQDGRKKIFTKEFSRAETAKKSLAVLTAEAIELAKKETGFHGEAKVLARKKSVAPGYYDSRGDAYELAQRLGSGGEGTVYQLKNSTLVAKIYHEPITVEKAEKLCWMAANKNEQLLKVAAWVVDVLRETPDGKIIGFLMPSIRAKEIHELYSLKSRRVYFSEATWHFLIHTAANVARAFYSLHKNGHVMGDVNHGNCVVLADGRVKLIDCDSYSIQTDKMRYKCEVGVATHLAPELHGANLSRIERLPEQDNFGMAIIIFQLLFLGRHPFAGNYLGAEDKSIEDCIREYRFAYGAGAARRSVAQPPGTLSLEAVSPRVAELFERAFTTKNNRPEPREWIEALEDLADSLEQCPQHPGHFFYEQNAHCPWCEIEVQTGIMVFPFVLKNQQLKEKDEKDFDIAHVENLVTTFETYNLPAKLRENIALAKDYLLPSAQLVAENRKQRNEQLIIICVYSAALFLLTIVIGSGCAFVLGIVALIVLYSRFGDLGKTIRTDERERLENAQKKWFKLENDWARLAAGSNLDNNLLAIRDRIAAYRRMESVAEESGSGDAPTTEKSEAALLPVGEEKNNLETEIGNLLATLRVGSVRVGKYQKQFQAQAQALVRELAQTESNVRFLGSNLPIGIILVLMTVGTPLFSSLMRGDLSITPPPPPPRINQVVVESNSYPSNSAPTAPTPKIGVFVPEENIPVRQIEAMSDEERTDIILELMRRADADIYARKYQDAEKKLKFALRFNDKSVSLLNKMGMLLYDRQRYEESLTYLNKSKSVTTSDDADFYIGMNYLQTKNYSEAKDIFLRLTSAGRRGNPAFYNLGSAYLGLKEYPQAIAAFQKALSFDPGDIDSTYQMGICYSKLGDAEQVRNFYLALKEKNHQRAEQFKKEVGKSLELETPPEKVAAPFGQGSGTAY